MGLLKEIYQKHSGKVSDKWTIYLNEYEEKLKPYQKLPINFFEIGVLNGGSLEIFSKYFSNAELILGCDIDSKCEKLTFSESNIKCIIGDANNSEIKNVNISKYQHINISNYQHLKMSTSENIKLSKCQHINISKCGFNLQHLNILYFIPRYGAIVLSFTMTF